MDPKERLDCLAFFWKTKPVPNKDKIRIEVNHVDHPHLIFFNIIDESYGEVFMPLMENLRDMYRENKAADIIPKSKLRLGLPCVVRHENVYFRGVIIHKSAECIKVRTVDYGKDLTITRAEYERTPLYWLSRSLATVPIQGIAGALKFLTPTAPVWTNDATELLMDLLYDREVHAVIINKGPPGSVVDLCLECPQTGMNIELELVKSGLANFIGENDPEQSQSDDADDSECSELPENEVGGEDEETDAPAGETMSFFSRAINALDCETASSCSDDDLDISVRVYSSDECDDKPSDQKSIENVLPETHTEVGAFEKDQKCGDDRQVVNEDVEDDTEEELQMGDDSASGRMVAPSETMTSVSMVGRLSNVNIGCIRDSTEREKMKQEIVLEMQSLQQRLAELNCILSSEEEECGASSSRLSPTASAIVPKPTSLSELRAEASEFVPKPTLSISELRTQAPEFVPRTTSPCNSELRVDTDAFVPMLSGTDSQMTSLRADANSFTPMSLETKEVEEKEEAMSNGQGRGFLPNVNEFVSGVTQYGDSSDFNRTSIIQPLMQITAPTSTSVNYYPTAAAAQPGVASQCYPHPGFPYQPGQYPVSNHPCGPSYRSRQSLPMFLSQQESWIYSDTFRESPLGLSLGPAPMVGSRRRDTFVCYQSPYGWSPR